MCDFKITLLKRKLRDIAKRLDSAYDSIDCGMSMAEYYSIDIITSRREFQETYAELRKLDPNAPPLIGKYV